MFSGGKFHGQPYHLAHLSGSAGSAIFLWQFSPLRNILPNVELIAWKFVAFVHGMVY